MPKGSRLSGRLARALLALFVSSVLVVSLMLQRAEVLEEEEELAFNLTAVSWKISEIVFETKRMELVLQAYEIGEAGRDEVILQSELLWSRVGLLKGADLRIDDKIVAAISALSDLLAAREAAIYDAPDLAVADAAALRVALSLGAASLRSLWISEFLSDREAMIRAGAVTDGAKFELLAAFSIAGLILYMIAELFMASRAQERESRLRKAAMAASEAKSAFLANVSHEIRTPLNGVLGMAQELSESPLSREQTELVDIMVGAGELLVATIDDVLDISKIESGRLELECAPFDLRQRIGQCIDLHKGKACDKGLDLVVRIGDGVPQNVRGDPMRLCQVLNNLISNALKFTQEGTVSVVIEPGAMAVPGGHSLTMIVEDTGIGIPEEARTRIFEPFTQADAGTARAVGGSGLGLAICRAICRQMGGDLGVRSRPGSGSTFIAAVQLFAASARAPEHVEHPEHAERTPPAAGIRKLLLVDDSRTNRMVMQRFLKDRAELIIEAENGREAVDAVLEQKFDLILMDIQMPGMDGVEATRRIRDHERQTGQPATPIVAVTANAMLHQVEEYHSNGMDRVISKPVKKAEILSLLSNLDSLRAA